MKHKVIAFAKQIAGQLTPIYEHEQERQQVAWWLLQAITQLDNSQLIAQTEIELSTEQEKILSDWLEKHVMQHMPLQYILGWVPFGNLTIFVEPPVLIPRPETEEWTINLSSKLQTLKNKNISILDVGTGTGCIALFLGKSLPHAHVLAIDISEKAINLAKKNAKKNYVTNVAFITSDIYDALSPADKFDVIVSNPPYISPHDWQYLDPLIKKWEDREALVAQDDGYAVIKKIINRAQHFLKPNTEMKNNSIPQMVIEIGYAQGKKIKQLLEEADFKNVKIEKDLEGKDRVATATI